VRETPPRRSRALRLSGVHGALFDDSSARDERSYPLDRDVIDELITRTSPGNYALGYMDRDGFNVFYVGRSDSDVRRRLHEWGRCSEPVREIRLTGKGLVGSAPSQGISPWTPRRLLP